LAPPGGRYYKRPPPDLRAIFDEAQVLRENWNNREAVSTIRDYLRQRDWGHDEAWTSLARYLFETFQAIYLLPAEVQERLKAANALAPEIVRAWRGETSFTIQHPWVVAFAFGLLHGFGFASGLTTMGLPRAEIPLALLLFNAGVELGQLGFVILILLLERSFSVLEVRWPRLVAKLPGYAVGTLGAYWTIQRTLILLGGLR
jgi:hypothetical protein